MNIVEKLQREAQLKNLTQEQSTHNIYTAAKLQYQQDYQKNKGTLQSDIKQDIKRIALKYPTFEKYALYRIYKQFDFNREIANEFISIQILKEEQATKEDGWIEVTSKRRALLFKFQKNANPTHQRSQSLQKKNDTIKQERSFSHERRNPKVNSKYSYQPRNTTRPDFCPYQPKDDSTIIQQRSKSPYTKQRPKSPTNYSNNNRSRQRIIYEPKQQSTPQEQRRQSVEKKENSREKPKRQIYQIEYVRKDELVKQQQSSPKQQEQELNLKDKQEQRILIEQQQQKVQEQEQEKLIEEQRRRKEEQIKESVRKQEYIKEQQRQQEIIAEQKRQDDLLKEQQRYQEQLVQQQQQQQQQQHQQQDLSQQYYPQQFIAQQFVEYPQYAVYPQNQNQFQVLILFENRRIICCQVIWDHRNDGGVKSKIKYIIKYIIQSKGMQQTNQLLQTISAILEEIVAETDTLPIETQTNFHAPKPPSISILNYVHRIAKYTHCSEPCFMIALIYLDRLQERHADLILNSHCIHRFIMVSMMVAIKYQDDDYYKNEYYAKVGGISLKEINQLEQDFLELLSFELYIDMHQYDVYENKLREYFNTQM